MQLSRVLHLVRADLHPIWWYMIFTSTTVTCSFVFGFLHEYIWSYVLS
jgi:hypothetical protein